MLHEPVEARQGDTRTFEAREGEAPAEPPLEFSGPLPTTAMSRQPNPPNKQKTPDPRTHEPSPPSARRTKLVRRPKLPAQLLAPTLQTMREQATGDDRSARQRPPGRSPASPPPRPAADAHVR